MKQRHSGEITDAFWEAARPLIPKRERETAREYRRKPGGGPGQPHYRLNRILSKKSGS
jgi:hypothetical protein